MLERIDASHFEQFQNEVQDFLLVDGSALRLRIDSITLKPLSRLPANSNGRVPFTVNLTALESTRFIEGPCTLELAGVGRVENIIVSRQAALGRDPRFCYFQIIFN